VKKLLVTTVAFTVLFSGVAFATGDCIGCTYTVPEPSAAYGTEKIVNVPVKQNPFDVGRLNESPIKGKGQISVVHNEPIPGDPDRKITDALWLLQDNSWTCYRPKMSRR
jgi:hypothetical protein